MARMFEPDSSTELSMLPEPSEMVPILIVSPFPEDHAVLQRVFSNTNWRLQGAADISQALNLLHEKVIPVVICERNLPPENWKILLDETLELPHPPRLIVASGMADDQLWAEVIASGAEEILPKPFAANEVLRISFLAWLLWKRTNRDPRNDVESFRETVSDKFRLSTIRFRTQYRGPKE
jgi:response regulator RpfG family c-di-GMP phosphodiesterase